MELIVVMSVQLLPHVPSELLLYPILYALIGLVPAATPLHERVTLSVLYDSGDAVMVVGGLGIVFLRMDAVSFHAL